MKYNFDEVVDRHCSDSIKWDRCDPEVIPMWIADMDFKAAPFIREAVRKRLDHGVFGYTHVPDKYYDAVADWFQRRRGWNIDKGSIQAISGLVPATVVALQALTAPGDKVLIHSPAYNAFFSTIANNGREVVTSDLIYDEGGELPTYRIDFEDFEKKCSDPSIKLFILCNPQNPAGRVWTREELRRTGEICLKHGIPVISDEIHCELEMPGYRYTSFAEVCPELKPLIFCSPSKSFNIAGLEIANMICADPAVMAKVRKVQEDLEMWLLNPLGVEALVAAYSPEGEEWLKELNAYIHANFEFLRDTLAAKCPQVRPCKLEGTYLAWVDCKALTAKGITADAIQDSLKANEKVWINSGAMYGDGNFMRINLACPRATLVEGLDRVTAGLNRLLKDA